MELKLSSLDKETIKLIADTVEDIAKAKGYMSYPKYHQVEMVLQAIMLINKAKEVIDDKAKRSKGAGSLTQGDGAV